MDLQPPAMTTLDPEHREGLAASLYTAPALFALETPCWSSG